ncbi:DNA topoisomerase I [Candidatus Bathyarchaeota archaeon]|nr:DNA topoisomerase I [Candidatus Bathyarchaeota archaeon]
MKQLIHNGVLIPKYIPRGFHIRFKGRKVTLTPEQEEMAVAFVKKLGTEYVKDRVFVKNFFLDFRKALNIEEQAIPQDFDFSEIQMYLEEEKAAKLRFSKEERKRLAEERKAVREANKQKYGYALVDGERVEIANYVAEPGCIFMGRGRHPLRGRWKPGPTEADIILNLSPDAPRQTGNWKEIVWEPNCMWIAKWDDKLRGKEKYVWLSDSAGVKQRRDIEKFELAKVLENKIETVRTYIMSNLQSEDLAKRKIATVCYLIDTLKMRVGDEKDKDETDTVGATTLRPKHVTIKSDRVVIFNFLGKDSVRWQKTITPPKPVVDNLREFIAEAKSSIFNGVRSEKVTEFLSKVVPGLTAKVFRTYHASKVVREYLQKDTTRESDPLYLKKYAATMANLQAAIVCNHRRKLPKKWRESLVKRRKRLKKLKALKTKRSKEAVKALEVRIKLMCQTRDYNLGTSLKSYIDPRIYVQWGQKVGFDPMLYYPKSLQRKFSWAFSHPENKTDNKDSRKVTSS